jgi:hypothetical protein
LRITFHPRKAEEVNMISLTPNTSACLYESTIITVVDRPPKQPPDDDDENEEDEEDDDEQDEEPAVIREPDEC